MGQNLPPFANAEDVAQVLLSTVATTVKATGDTIAPPLIVVRKIGGKSDYVTDFPQVMVTAIGATRAASTVLALQCQAAIENAFNTQVTLADGSVVVIDGTYTHTSTHPEPYENLDIREVAAVYELRMRRPRVPAP